MTTLTHVGIDVASKKFDIAVITGDEKYKTKVFSNTQKGFAELLNWLEPTENAISALKQGEPTANPLPPFSAMRVTSSASKIQPASMPSDRANCRVTRPIKVTPE